MFLLKLALRPWRLAPFNQTLTSVAVGFLLLLTGFLFWMQQGLKTVIVRLQGEQVVTAYLLPNVAKEEEALILENIRVLFSNDAPEIKLVSVPQFLGEIRNFYPDLVREIQDLGQEMNQVVPRYISISGNLRDAVLEKIKAVSGIESVESSKDRYRSTVGVLSAIRWVIRVLIGGVCLALLVELIHLSKMNAYLQRDSIQLLRLWGAGQTTLASPSMLSGCSVGLLGGLVAWGGWMTVGIWLTQHVKSLSTVLKGIPAMTSTLAISLFLIGGGLGLVAGMLGGLSSRIYGASPEEQVYGGG